MVKDQQSVDKPLSPPPVCERSPRSPTPARPVHTAPSSHACLLQAALGSKPSPARCVGTSTALPSACVSFTTIKVRYHLLQESLVNSPRLQAY